MRVLVLVAIAAVVTGPAFAGGESACVSDAKKLCPDSPHGGGSLLRCLKGNWSKLSSSCQQDFQRHNARVANVTAACSADIWQSCQGVVAGSGRV